MPGELCLLLEEANLGRCLERACFPSIVHRDGNGKTGGAKANTDQVVNFIGVGGLKIGCLESCSMAVDLGR